ncbi:MAG: phosphoglycerate kinase, partial [Candidatus Binatia bacterium]
AKDLGVPLLLPIDHIAKKKGAGDEKPITVEGSIPPDYAALDIGPRTVAQFSQAIESARMVLWNGPMGLFEEKPFDLGTRSIAQALARSPATSIVAGGDSVAAVREAGVEDKITHLSTGGGATLEFLEGKKLPGVQALEESF